MKKVMSIALVGIFVLTFAATAFVSQPKAGVVPLCWKAGECNYETGKVYICCLEQMGRNGTVMTRCYWDDTYFEQWCVY